ncbi:ATP-binding protein [Parasedimentitalea maritima]|uniref:histidine kinase n=1 Tax=Parasedimentitalea maritima TaxID=2578117 RepID=A0A6A4R9N5_9RHOB|nr:ATP-binding protein [Zongyanglinia marina]KAE9625908.1 HAMP domain-containing protein [Zongyanglinia marina]
MIPNFANRWMPSIWARLMVVVLAIVTIVWAVLAVAIWFFNQVNEDYATLAGEHIPRIALASELAENSAKLAYITAAIVGRQDGEQAMQFQASLEEVVLAISAQVDRAGPARGKPLGGGLRAMLEQVLEVLDERHHLARRITARVGDLRWLNVDIQDEVDPLLSDFTFNIAVATDSLAKSADRAFRTGLAERITAERDARDLVQELGGEAATLVTLIVQSSVATEPTQLIQFRNLAEDSMTRLSIMAAALPNASEYLTLRQSVQALGPLAQGSNGMFALRGRWFDSQLQLLDLLNSVQTRLAGVQSELAGIGAIQRVQVLAVTQASAARSQLAIRVLIGLTVLAGLIGVLALFGYVRQGIIRPLGEMSAAMMAIARGEPPEKLPPIGDDEIGQMAHAVGVFQQSVQARDEANSRLMTEVAERRRAVETLKRTQEDLVQAGKLAALGQMSSGISHELNQPLAAMKHRIHLLKEGHDKGAEEMVQRQIERMDGLTNRMEATITHLKRFARRSTYRSDVLSLGPLIRESALLLKGRIDAPGIELEVCQDLEQAQVQGDQILIEQVLVNLLSNALDAINSTGRGTGKIGLSGTSEDGQFSLVVADDGIGLGDLSPESVFDPFVTTKEVGKGLGLGLSISYNIVKGMGGDLKLVDNAPHGTCAVLILPAGDPNS